MVEDAALVAMLLEEMLDDLGFDVIGPATDHASACQMAREPGMNVVKFKFPMLSALHIPFLLRLTPLEPEQLAKIF